MTDVSSDRSKRQAEFVAQKKEEYLSLVAEREVLDEKIASVYKDIDAVAFAKLYSEHQGTDYFADQSALLEFVELAQMNGSVRTLLDQWINQFDDRIRANFQYSSKSDVVSFGSKTVPVPMIVLDYSTMVDRKLLGAITKLAQAFSVDGAAVEFLVFTTRAGAFTIKVNAPEFMFATLVTNDEQEQELDTVETLLQSLRDGTE